MQIKKRQMMIGAGGAALSTLLPGSAGAVTALVPPPMTLVATYFGGWCKPMDASQRFVHGDNPWGVYPNAQFPHLMHHMGDFPERFPLAGPPEGYDESQQSVIDEALVTASSFGIDVFAVNWFRDEFLNHPVVNIKRSADKGLMKFFLQWSNNSNNSTQPPADSREYFFEGIRRAAIHMKDSAYWTRNGKPVFAIYSVAQIDRIINLTLGRPANFNYPTISQATLEHDAFLQDCHNIVANVIAGDDTGGISGHLNATVVRNGTVVPASVNTSGIVGSFTPSMYLMVATGDVGSWARCASVQGMYVYNTRSGKFPATATSPRLTHSFAEMATACQQVYDLVIPAMRNFAPGKVWWPTLMSGFDQKPWGGTTQDPLHDNCLPTVEEFKNHCLQVKAVHQQNPDVTGGVTFIYAWNELGEGGWIVPTPAIGTSRLEALRDSLKRV